MTKRRKITILSHIRNLKDVFILFPIGFIVSYLLYLSELNEKVFVIFGILFLLSLIPVVLIHMNFFKTDKNKILTIDPDKKSFELKVNAKTIKVNKSDIQTTIMTTGFERSASGTWSGYFFYQIELINGEIIYLTSLLLRKKDFPLHVDLKRHIAFPFVKYFDLETTRLKETETKEIASENLVNRYYEKYSNYSLNDLKGIVNNKEDFQVAAVQAAEKLINDKFTVANKR